MTRSLRRPTTIEEVRERLAHFRSPEADAALEAFSARASDVFVCTYTKCGTTWTQQIVHQLRSGASMDFDEISVVVPWLESAVDCGMDPDAEQGWQPRVFKSHLPWSEAPRGGRYISVFRDPATVLPSFHRFFEGWWFEPGTIDLASFAHGLYLQGTTTGSHWGHFVDWWPHVDDPDVLVLAYEDMVAAPDRVPGVIAEFLQMDIDPETMTRVIENCSREVMQEHADKFSEGVLRRNRDHVWGLPPGGDAVKVTAGSARELPPDVVEALDARWAHQVEAALGFADYAELRAALPDPLGVR